MSRSLQYASWDPTWERVFREQEWGRYPAEHIVRFVATRWYRVPDRAAVHLLDLGSGPGASTWYMAREGFTVSAIDGSPTAIGQLQARLDAEGLHADARVGDLIELPWPDGAFEGVVDNVALYANPYANCRHIVGEVYRVLAPGGHFLSVNFSDRSWGSGLGREVEPGGFADITAGPCRGKGFALFMSRAQVDTLYALFEHVSVNTVSWSLEGGEQLMELWVVTCCKRLQE
jgi:SAM-dependent methyltransferase